MVEDHNDDDSTFSSEEIWKELNEIERKEAYIPLEERKIMDDPHYWEKMEKRFTEAMHRDSLSQSS